METTAHPTQPIFPMARNNDYKLTKNGMEIDPKCSGHPKVTLFRKIFPFTSRPILVAVSLVTRVWWHKYAWVNGVKLASVYFHPFGETPLSDPIAPYCQLEPSNPQTSMNQLWNLTCIMMIDWTTCGLMNVCHFSNTWQIFDFTGVDKAWTITFSGVFLWEGRVMQIFSHKWPVVHKT